MARAIRCHSGPAFQLDELIGRLLGDGDHQETNPDRRDRKIRHDAPDYRSVKRVTLGRHMECRDTDQADEIDRGCQRPGGPADGPRHAKLQIAERTYSYHSSIGPSSQQIRAIEGSTNVASRRS